MNIKIKESTKKEKAGKDLISESLTFICIITAPNINTAIPMASGFTNSETYIPIISKVAKISLRAPVNIINQLGKP